MVATLVIKAFTESIKKQIRENNEFKDNMKLLEDKGNKISDSEAMKRARKATSASTQAMKRAVTVVGSSVGDGFSRVADTSAVKATGKAVSRKCVWLSSNILRLQNAYLWIVSWIIYN